MDYLPLFADLKQRPVLVVGGGEVAARKIRLLRQAGARVKIVSKTLTAELKDLQDEGKIQWIAQDFQAEQLDDIFLVIAATNNHALNTEIFEAAEQRQRLINVVDDQSKCSFIFPSIVDRSPVTIAISSAGHAPVLIRLLREKLEALLPQSLGEMAKIAGRWRPRIKKYFPKIKDRRRFWEKAFTGLFAHQVAKGQITEAEATLENQLENIENTKGEIILVGAGPGDADLLTLRGLQAIQEADVVLYDYLVSQSVLDMIRRDASRFCVGKRAGHHSVAQAETNQMLVSLALEGKRVVRLKGGDPFIFGRGGEELQAAKAAGIPFQVVPGITAASGAAAYAGIPLTHRDYSQSVVFITGHCRKDSDGLDWATLARSHQTLAIYMGTVKAAQISEQLIRYGRATDTPVAVIARAATPDQQVFIGRLDQLENLVQQALTPALLIIGEVAALHSHLAWFRHQSNREDQHSSVMNLA
ncbi:MAG: siroheme synthase CysG [Zymomonas mobilis subsp. pomaceae]|uniref:Siroheme synthase n=1 Tax=Zymomonas mobilis subsp. pomaceae (strain ATCC 29192 / DSM 22645 / JCM 10191 / CCUG 17912 / NBRC 13757 / NCIMB 11200 / NRRL B-4491 / Barker I) TaxID=579138 RepID=F8ETF5_ZYMMT|nr:siroheme synthase CysG [Zymomonas mobilis]AEI37980.1 uroporphyrin-III C-methyltransferase [Zymomonas mobilis subsp. pomaceae ATCC 29192]MDX5949348.1 siroheme synthase CysG [Zymomonas mobilis subsp. pomaceae]GEB89920.1 siroheme synthase 1 [Zymomonas mobilis subsp. pomaceae]